MSKQDFLTVWDWLDHVEKDLKHLRKYHPDMPECGLMDEILRLRAWATQSDQPNQPAA